MALDHKEQLIENEALEKVRELLKSFQIAMMVTVSDEAVSARPLGVVGGADPFDGGSPGKSGNAGIANLP